MPKPPKDPDLQRIHQAATIAATLAGPLSPVELARKAKCTFKQAKFAIAIASGATQTQKEAAAIAGYHEKTVTDPRFDPPGSGAHRAIQIAREELREKTSAIRRAAAANVLRAVQSDISGTYSLQAWAVASKIAHEYGEDQSIVSPEDWERFRQWIRRGLARAYRAGYKSGWIQARNGLECIVPDFAAEEPPEVEPPAGRDVRLRGPRGAAAAPARSRGRPRREAPVAEAPRAPDPQGD